MRLYVAGPMTGYPRWNFGAFETATAALRGAGFDVISPAEIDIEGGFDPDAPIELYTQTDRVNALRRDILALLDVDGVALLDGWENSSGARLEAHIGESLDLMVAPVEAFLTMARLNSLEGNK